MKRARSPFGRALERFSVVVSRWSGSSPVFAVAAGAIVVWAALGPVFGFSTTWQLVINTGTTIVTFLMVFLIQRAQNKDAMAIQLKLNELVKAVHGASNRLIDIEDLEEDELEALHLHYARLAELAKQHRRIAESHSLEVAEALARAKASGRA
jgi:low affinity Fe/Cu permease